MSITEFTVGHLTIQRGDYSCCSLLRELDGQGISFISVCLVRVLAPRNLMVPYLLHKIDGKLMFFLCRECSLNGAVQCRPCCHNRFERSWLDTYTSIDMQAAFKVGYEVLKYHGLWHYPRGGSKFFRDFILNIVRRKIECSGFPPTCTTDESKHFYMDELLEKSLVKMSIDCIWSDPAGRYLSKIMANSMWESGHKIHLVNKK